MFNPLAIFDARALEGFVREGNKYFVRQSFPRGMDPFDDNLAGCFLICHYDDYFRAKEHYDALEQDRLRWLYNYDKMEDRGRLEIAASQPEGYRVYSNTFVPDWERHLTDRVKERIRAYVAKLGWKPSRGEGVEPQFYPHFGEVHVCLKFRGREVRVKFEEIENTL